MSVVIEQIDDRRYSVNEKFVFVDIDGSWKIPDDELTPNEMKEFQSYLNSKRSIENDDFQNVKRIISTIDARILDTKISFRVERDNEFPNGRIFIQPTYYARCTKTNITKEWHGRKWYLSRHMTKDEIIKTAYAGFEACVKHEAMEGFRVNGKILFNPHTSYEALLEISSIEVKRTEPQIH